MLENEIEPSLQQGYASENLAVSAILNGDEKLLAHVRSWREKLLDLGNRNSLINCSLHPTRGALEIAFPATEAVWTKLAADSEAGSTSMRFPWRRDLIPPPKGTVASKAKSLFAARDGEDSKEWTPSLDECKKSPRLRGSDLLTAVGDNALNRRLRTLDGHAKLSMSEQGVHCLYIAFGFLKWFESTDSDQELRSPLVLVPVTLSRSSADAPWEVVEAEDDAVDNLCLRQRLRTDFGLELPPLPDIDTLEDPGARQRFLYKVRGAIEANERWEVEERCAIGRFAFPKVAMWKDLGDQASVVVSHELCRSIAGDDSIPQTQSFGLSEGLPEVSKLDQEILPGDIKAILDCDSSQLEAIVAARRGVSFVLDGPPGTGKSQTIANIIADSLAEGRRVLFVSEKVSALEVVKRRLDDCGLGEFCLECHSSKANRKTVLDELQWCLNLAVEVYDDPTPKFVEAKRSRDSLNEYVKAIHRPREPLGLSPFELFGHVTRLARLGFAAKSRCDLPNVAAIDRESLARLEQLLECAKEHAVVLSEYDEHPWRNCLLTSRSLSLTDDLHNHFGVLAQTLESLGTAIQCLIDEGHLKSELTLGSLNDTVRQFRDCLSAPIVPASWYLNPSRTAAAILARSDSLEKIQHQRLVLKSYVDDVDTRFPIEDAIAIANPAADAWQYRLKARLPNELREQRNLFKSLVPLLRKIADVSSETKFEVKRLTSHLGISENSQFPVSSLPKLAQIARVIAESGTLRPAWFEANQWTPLRQLGAEMLAKLEFAGNLEKTLAGSIARNQIIPFSESIGPHGDINSISEVIRRSAPQSRLDDIDALAGVAFEFMKSLVATLESSSVLLIALGLKLDQPITLESLESLVKAAESFSGVTQYHGSWSDKSVRGKVLNACSAAIADLDEAEEIRQQCQDRLSHRAFKTSSAELVARGTEFESILNRWFGKFGAFRESAADLYKSGVVDTSSLLADCAVLRKFHRRLNDVRDAATEIIEYLPTGFQFEEISSWRDIQAAVRACETLFASVPATHFVDKNSEIEVDQTAFKVSCTRILSECDNIRGLREKLSGCKVQIEGSTLESLLEGWSKLSDAVLKARHVWKTAEPFYTITPQSIASFVDDVSAAVKYKNCMCDVTDEFERNLELMPRGTTSNDPECWRRLMKGIDAVERLCGLVAVPPPLRDRLCAEGGTNCMPLLVAADAIEISHQKLEAALFEVGDSVELTPPDEGPVNPQRRSAEMLEALATNCAGEFEVRRERLDRLLDAIRPNESVQVESLASSVIVVEELKAELQRCQQIEFSLTELGIDFDMAPVEAREAAIWLAKNHAGGSLTDLVVSATSNGIVRQKIQAIHDEIKRRVNGDFKAAWGFLKSLFDINVEVSSGFVIADTPIRVLAEKLTHLRSDTDSLDAWLKFNRWNRDMASAGIGGVVEELLAGRYGPHEAIDAIRSRIYRSLFDHLASQDRLLSEFDLDAHERCREQFRKLDQWEIKAAASRIRQYQLGREDRPRPGWMAATSSEVGILQREVQKKRRHMPLRKLFSDIPGLLQRLKPCIMMSPLSVSTLLQSQEIRFDLVIFDEASQVFPWDAIGAIYRGRQLIVAGDEKQLPPTNFFNRADIETDDEDDAIGDFESILSLCKSINMPSRRLRWHYRSRREPLIAFSNRHFYDNDLVTFPSVLDASGDSVRLEFVNDGRWVDRKNLKEAERVADLVIEHMRAVPTASLGVIAFNASQQQAIEDVIYERRRTSQETDQVFGLTTKEPFFVKNLENVQGDERDVIILSMGYGINDAGKFLKNFGPLTKAGGERRLNVAVTRAREQVIFVASVRSSDMDLAESKSKGSHLLKAYLEYAERGVDSLARAIDSVGGDTESPFEYEVAAALIQRGVVPVAQVGCGGFRIDLALKHPQRLGEFCLGIECDGATYHSSHTARDRDRIRQSVLESLGWRIVRVWSTDWIRSPERQLERILAAYEVAATTEDPFPKSVSSSEDDDESLKPHLVEEQRQFSPTFDNIELVPTHEIQSAALVVLTSAGATDWDDVIKLVARQLGFARTGRKIRERLEEVLNKEIRAGQLRRIGDRVTISSGD